MALSPYQFRPLTPPVAEEVPALIPGSHSRTVSDFSSRSARSSPEYPDSFEFDPSTPLDQSPVFHSGGPVLIPQVRKQDLCPEPTFKLSPPRSHRRSSSVSSTLRVPHVQASNRHQARATTQPPEVVNYDFDAASSCNYAYPASAADFILGSSAASLQQAPRRPRGHSRSISESVLRNSSAFLQEPRPHAPHRTAYVSSLFIPATINQSEFDFASPIDQPLAAPVCDISDELLFSNHDESTVSQFEYFGRPAPLVQVCRQQPHPLGRNKKPQYWFDIRNVAEWDDFSFEAILQTPSFPGLLTVPVSETALEEPLVLPSRLKPADQNDLKHLVREYFAAKVNAGLRVSQGASRHMAMRLGQNHGGADFVSNYEMPSKQTIAGNGSRGRVVGIVKSFDTWNTSMRSSLNPNERCRYLDGLSHLQRCMREAECRYGFIITETELLCVRYGGEATPCFGFLELATSIRLNETTGLTACLALWYLHMLASDDDFGQVSYRVHIGLPGELTRQNVLPEKDTWIAKLKIAEFEKREAKQTRGWADPTDKWNRKLEGGGMRRRR